MDLFKLRRDGAGGETEATSSLEALLTAPVPSPSRSSSEQTAPPPALGAGVSQGFGGFSQDHAPGPGTIISEGCQINGVVKSNGNLRVDGKFDGEVDVRSLVIGPTGVLSGQCRCDSLLVIGRFRGEVDCRELQISAGAVVDGDITYAVMRADRGAELIGTYSTKKPSGA